MYVATDRRSERQVAIKVATALDLDNLKNEISMQNMSRHPNIVEYIETYLHSGKLWVRGGAHVLASCVAVGLTSACRRLSWSTCRAAP